MVAYALPAVFAACLVLATLPQLLAEPYPRIVTGQTVDVGSNVREWRRAGGWIYIYLFYIFRSSARVLRRFAASAALLPRASPKPPAAAAPPPLAPQVLTLLAPSFTWLLLLTAMCVGAAWLALRAVFAADAKNPVKAFFTRLFATEDD